MTEEQLADARACISRVVRAAVNGVWWQTATGPLTDADHPPLTPGQLLGLAALLKDEAVTPQVLADFLLDVGHEYATAVAERAAREERERIAERLYSESAHQLSKGPDGNDTYEYTAAALSSIADDLVFGVPPTSPGRPGAQAP